MARSQDFDQLPNSRKMMAAALMQRMGQPNPSLGGSILNGLSMGLLGLIEKDEQGKMLELERSKAEMYRPSATPPAAPAAPMVPAYQPPDPPPAVKPMAQALGGDRVYNQDELNPMDKQVAAPKELAAALDPRFGKAIAGIESGGKYDKLGPVTKTGDRAYGKYQVMGANIPQWSQEALGTKLTPEQFLADQKAQDAVFNTKFGTYEQKYGPEGAAKAWFAGERGMNNPGARDQLGTSVADYASKFTGGVGQQPQLPPAITQGPPQPAPQLPPSTNVGPVPQPFRLAQAGGEPQVPQMPTNPMIAEAFKRADAAYAAGNKEAAMYWSQQGRALGQQEQEKQRALQFELAKEDRKTRNDIRVKNEPSWADKNAGEIARQRAEAELPFELAKKAGMTAEQIAKEKDKQDGKTALASRISTIGSAYKKLNEAGAVINSDKGVTDNLSAAGASGWTGHRIGQITGSPSASVRQEILNSRPALISAIMKASGMSAKSMDSNVELQFYLDQVTNPANDLWSNLSALHTLDKQYGLGDTLKGVLPKEDYERLEQGSAAMKPPAGPPAADGWSIKRVR